MRQFQMSVLLITAFLIAVPGTATLAAGHSLSGFSLNGLTSTPPVWAFNGSYEVYNGTMKINGTLSQVNTNLTIVDVNPSNQSFTVLASGTGSSHIASLSQQLLPGNQSSFMIPMPFLAISPTVAAILPFGSLISNATGLNVNLTISSVQLVKTPAGTFSGYNVSLASSTLQATALIDAMNGVFASASIYDSSMKIFINITLVKTNVPATQFSLVNNLNNYLAGNNLYIIGGALTALDAIVIGAVLLKRVRG